MVISYSYGKSPFLVGKSSLIIYFYGPFSIAILNNQRVIFTKWISSGYYQLDHLPIIFIYQVDYGGLMGSNGILSWFSGGLMGSNGILSWFSGGLMGSNGI